MPVEVPVPRRTARDERSGVTEYPLDVRQRVEGSEKGRVDTGV